MSRIVMRSPLPLFRPETRSRRIAVLLGVLWLLAFADLFFTVWAHQFTRFEELNPIARRILHTNSLLALVIYKVVLTGIATLIFWSFRKHRIAELGTWLVVIAYLALTLRWSDYTQNALEPGMIGVSVFRFLMAG
ncbi:MAG TPA: DUF5658 family protein [Tepidisphaeraceae bacterium]|nr:DUF5658 family protein [Tepidisphaeraceae bacterium]